MNWYTVNGTRKLLSAVKAQYLRDCNYTVRDCDAPSNQHLPMWDQLMRDRITAFRLALAKLKAASHHTQGETRC